jgi:hypothetical protein
MKEKREKGGKKLDRIYRINRIGERPDFGMVVQSTSYRDFEAPIDMF